MAINTMALSIASNSIDRESQITRAIEWLRKSLRNARFSAVYNTTAVNHRDHDYLNAVVIAETTKNLEQTTDLFKRYETTAGRTAAAKVRGIVAIDIDIVVWNGETLRRSDFRQSYFQLGWQELNPTNS